MGQTGVSKATLLKTAIAGLREKKPGDHDRLVALHYAHYGELCMTKHLNPIVERARGYIREGNQTKFVHGPDVSEMGLQHVLFALDSRARHAWFALLAFTKHGPQLTKEMMLEMQSISSEIRTILP